jgi:hypothetical protein
MRNYLSEMYTTLHNKPDLRRVVAFVGPKDIIKLTRQHRANRFKSRTYLLTVGSPNFAERAKIKTMVKEKTRFPVLEQQEWPVKRKQVVRTAGKATKKAVKK